MVGAGTDPVEIVCSYWTNPITPSIVSGFNIRTYDSDGNIYDKSSSFDLDATGLESATIADEDIAISLSVPAVDEVSSYTISFTVDTPIETTGECFVKITFPEEIDVSGVILENIQGSGLFIDETGSIITYDADDIVSNLDENWLMVHGCEFNPMDKTTDELVNFVKDQFTITYTNIVNPSSRSVSPFKI